MNKQTIEKKPSEKPRNYWKFFKRGLLGFGLLSVILILLGWVFLPRIAERVIRTMITEAGIDQASLKVSEIGWRAAEIKDITASGDTWAVKAGLAKVNYDPLDLIKGRLQNIDLEGFIAEVVIPSSQSDNDGSPQKDMQTANLTWLHRLPSTFKKIGEIRASNAEIICKRGASHLRKSATVLMKRSRDGKLTTEIITTDFTINTTLANTEEKSDIALLITGIHPAAFIDMLDFLLDKEDSLLPEGFKITGAELSGDIDITDNELSPLSITGDLTDVVYKREKNPIILKSNTVVMKLAVDFGGSGRVDFDGKMDAVSMPLDPSIGLALHHISENKADWGVRVTWGEEDVGLSGNVMGLSLGGTYDGQPVELDNTMLDFTMEGEDLKVTGSFENGGLNVPLKYQHSINNSADDHWLMNGQIVIGPIDHSRPLPLLSAATDLFEGVELNGTSLTNIKFTVGSHQSFSGKMITRISDASLSLAEGMLNTSGVNGIFEMNFVPLADNAPEHSDPSFYTLNFTAKTISIASEKALDYDLHHQVDTPVSVTGKGHFGMDANKLEGEVKNLTLHGQKDGSTIDFNSTEFSYTLSGDILTADGKTTLGENDIPFKYRHERKSRGDDWDLTGWLQIKEVKLANPLNNGVMFIDAMKEKSLSGVVSLKMDFTTASDRDFDGVLTAAISDGKLSFADNGPVIEGLEGDIRLSSMKTKEMKEFHQVTATRVNAWDVEMTSVRLDFKFLTNGDAQLRNIRMKALGGQVWLDPFTLPGGDEDYKFKVRAKKLDLAQLAKLFPNFNGTINGSIDGLLPMESVGGDIRPSRGGMYLTPRSRAKLRYDAGNKLSDGIDPKTEEYKKMKMVEDSLRNLDLKVLSIRLFDPQDKDKALVLRLVGSAPTVEGSPPIILNINGFKPDDDTVDFFDLLLKHRDKLNFGL